MAGTVHQIYYNVYNNYEIDPIQPSSKEEFFEKNLLAGYSGSATKIAIQAPPGTKFQIGPNANGFNARNIIVGRNGIYELDAGINISYLYFPLPLNYKKDEVQSQAYVDLGIKSFKALEARRAEELDEIKDKDEEEYGDEFKNIQDRFLRGNIDVVSNQTTTTVAGYQEALNI